MRNATDMKSAAAIPGEKAWEQVAIFPFYIYSHQRKDENQGSIPYRATFTRKQGFPLKSLILNRL
jgi:hypothetical protein